MKEIERKFLVDLKKINLKSLKKEKIIQGYLSTDPVIRVRIKNNKAFLTIKGPGQISRLELEYSIPIKDAKKLLKLTNIKVEKTRYLYPFEGKTWEIDIFLGANKGLAMAEIELKSIKEKFKKPDFVLKEVSLENKFSNAQLALNPYSQWKV